jgi:hypothetical protein
MLQRLSIMRREIDRETVDAVRLNTHPPQLDLVGAKVF